MTRPSKKEILEAIDKLPEPRRKLRMSFIPRPLHGKNLRVCVGKHYWRKLRKHLLEGHGLDCDICGVTVEAYSALQGHEEWSYLLNNRPPLSVLIDITFACHLCHSAEHFGNTKLRVLEGVVDLEYLDRVVAHYCAVNRVTLRTFTKDLGVATSRWELLSALRWETSYGDYTEWVVEILQMRLAVIRKRHPNSYQQTLSWLGLPSDAEETEQAEKARSKQGLNGNKL